MWEKRKLNVVGVLLCVFCDHQIVLLSFLSSDFKANSVYVVFFLFFLLTHPGQRRHSGDSSYWRRPRDGGRQNKERQGVHARTYGTTHLFNSHTHRELYDLCLIFRFAGFGCEILVAVLLWNTPPLPPPGGWRRWSSSSLSSSVAEDSQSECLCVCCCLWLVRPVRLRLRCHIYLENLTHHAASAAVNDNNNNNSTNWVEMMMMQVVVLFPRLETVHLELVRLRQARLGQPLANVFPLVALQLQNLTVLGVLDHSAIARKFLLTCSHDLLQIVLRRQTLHGG